MPPHARAERVSGSGTGDLAEWHTRTGRSGSLALVARAAALPARGWRWSLANLALATSRCAVGGVVALAATALAAEV